MVRSVIDYVKKNRAARHHPELSAHEAKMHCFCQGDIGLRLALILPPAIHRLLRAPQRVQIRVENHISGGKPVVFTQ
jgi:hypothetical protein